MAGQTQPGLDIVKQQELLRVLEEEIAATEAALENNAPAVVRAVLGARPH